MDLLGFCLLLSLLFGTVILRPVTQRIVIENHEWEVPNEPGWEEIIRSVHVVQQRLASCITAAECRKITEEIRSIFYQYPVSKDYFETDKEEVDDLFQTIFKWG